MTRSSWFKWGGDFRLTMALSCIFAAKRLSATVIAVSGLTQGVWSTRRLATWGFGDFSRVLARWSFVTLAERIGFSARS